MTLSLSILTTTTRLSSSGGGGGWPGGGGCGTAASSPLGVSGVIVMKITSNTSSTSIKGVMLMSALAAIFFFLDLIRRLLSPHLIVEPLGQQAHFVHAGAPDIVHDVLDVAVFRSSVALHKNDLVELVA